MHRALRRASTSVAALAILGCTGDNPVAPETTWPEPSASASQLAPSAYPPDDARLPIVVAVAPPPAVSVTAPLTRTTVGTSRYIREQSLGFRNNVAGANTPECLTEGDSFGSWQLRFSGYGCVGLTHDGSATSMSLLPMVATANDETHAPLLLGPEYGDRLQLTTRLETVQQLRQNGQPNAWEVAWLLWQYQDDEHFYYFIPKPNGWEVGKRDPAYPGGQRFLATGTDLKFPVGRAYNVQITHKGNSFSVTVDGVVLTKFADTERPYVSGRIALYSEDAEIRVHQVSVRTGAI
ncbi:MAG: hypothetical protein ABI120_22165 [Gemmatimonadaceae bacterium]